MARTGKRDDTDGQETTLSDIPNNPAMIVHHKYPHTGVVHDLTPGGVGKWYEHALPNGRIAVTTWLYEGDDAKRRTIIVREWNNPDSPVYVASNVYHAAQASHKTNEFLDKLAAL
jgi:hypothetical protein